MYAKKTIHKNPRRHRQSKPGGVARHIWTEGYTRKAFVYVRIVLTTEVGHCVEMFTHH